MTQLIPGNLFSETDLQLLMSRLWALMAVQTERYTMGDSTSVPIEVAEELLASLWYTLTVVMEQTHTPYDRLLTEELTPMVRQGQTILRDKLEDTKRLWEAVCKTAPDIRNSYYEDTLRGIGGYFKHYDSIFFAHQKPSSIDYPLLNTPSESVQGITFTERYLKCLLAENLILHRFEKRAVIRILRKIAPDYQEFYLNLCEQPFTNAIGSALIGKGGRTLYLGQNDRMQIANKLQNRSHEELQQILRSAARTVCDDLGVFEGWVRTYVSVFAESLLPRLDAALESEDLSRIFVEACDESPANPCF